MSIGDLLSTQVELDRLRARVAELENAILDRVVRLEKADARVAELEANLDIARTNAASADLAHEKLMFRVAELEGALRPFADFAEKAEQFVEARAKDGGSPILPSTDFRLADFRRARAVLNAPAKEKQE